MSTEDAIQLCDELRERIRTDAEKIATLDSLVTLYRDSEAARAKAVFDALKGPACPAVTEGLREP